MNLRPGGEQLDSFGQIDSGLGLCRGRAPAGQAKLFGMLGPTYVPWVDVDLDAAFDALDRPFRAAVALREAGLEFVHAPITRADGDVLARLGDYAVSVFPFIDAVSYKPARDGRRCLLAAVGRLHAASDAVPRDYRSATR